MPHPKIIGIDEKSIQKTETELNILYPAKIRAMFLVKNGFNFAGFRFYKIYNKNDIVHTFDDLIRENLDVTSGWKKYLPEGFVAIADNEGQGCLALNTNKDGKLYYWNKLTKTISEYKLPDTDN